ncbi:hypothetical protein [Mesorhizobium sp. NFR06]|uniref:hypothetical protein n=1 Tax=Mesorhizobium sp. NFR06 TaxID=1566290 RepID=UPI00165F0061|nr:hypothetical protein [Mesorhizobium sp. NFR06]
MSALLSFAAISNRSRKGSRASGKGSQELIRMGHAPERRLPVAFEKRQLGRVAKPELCLAGVASEGAHRLEP